MKGRYRRKSRAQAQHEIVVSQKEFEGGERSDIPASDIGEKEVALLENAIAFPEYIEGRGGSKRFSDTALPGSGTILLFVQHPTTKKYLLQRGQRMYVGASDMASWTEVTLYSNDFASVSIAGDAGSQLSGVSLFHVSSQNTDNGVLYWNLTNSGSTRTLNIYSDSAKTTLVASASRVGNGDANIIPEGASGVYGRVTITYTGDDTTSGNTLTVSLTTTPWISSNSNYSDVRFYEKDFVVFNQDVGTGQSIWHISGTAYSARTLNFSIPDTAIVNISGTPYIYRYIITFSRIEDSSGNPGYSLDRTTGVLVHESPPNAGPAISNESGDYGTAGATNPISISNPLSIYLTDDGTASGVGLGSPDVSSVDSGDTHISIYRTLDIGANGVDPVSGSGNNPEIYVWVADHEIGDTVFSDTIEDDVLRARFYAGLSLKNRFNENIPASDIGEITPTFFYAALRGSQIVYYGQLADKQFIGTYNPASQYFRLDDGVQAIVKSPDMVTIICAGRTYISSPNSYVNNSSVESVFVLNHITVADESVGVTDYGSLTQIEAGVFIAHCSDHSIRVWDGANWGKDISSRFVNKIVRQMVMGSVGGYFAGAYYIWYRSDSSQTYNNACLRFGFGRDNGYGWSRMTGSGWVYPPLYVGCRLIQDANSVQRLLILDSPGSAFYWIETFDSYTGSGLSKVYTDKVTTAGVAGTEISGAINFRDVTGPEESHTLYHQETHGYLRPSVSSGFPAAFAISMVAYVDGATTPVVTQTGLNQRGDWQSWTMIEGRRIQMGLRFATSGWQLTGMDSHFQAHDKASIGLGPADTADATYQGELASSLTHWLTRMDANLNLATGTDYSLTGTAPTQVSGPDGKSYALSFVSGASYTQADATSYSDFTIAFWLKGMTTGSRILQITGSSSFHLTLTSNTSLSVNGDGSVTLSTVASGWHQIVATRNGSTVTVYQNGASVGTVTVATARGGTSVSINPDGVAMQIYDLRIKGDDISAGAVLYAYTDVTSFSGNRTLPSSD